MTKIEMLNKTFKDFGGSFVNETVESYAKRHTKEQVKNFCEWHANNMKRMEESK